MVVSGDYVTYTEFSEINLEAILMKDDATAAQSQVSNGYAGLRIV